MDSYSSFLYYFPRSVKLNLAVSFLKFGVINLDGVSRICYIYLRKSWVIFSYAYKEVYKPFMIILFWFLVVFLLGLSTLSFLWLLFMHPRFKEAAKTVREGFFAGLKGSGLTVPKHQNSVELWKWETMSDEDVCEDCQERASWPPMDIADWMKEGLPRTPESETKCGENCRCQLVRYYPGFSSKKYFNH